MPFNDKSEQLIATADPDYGNGGGGEVERMLSESDPDPDFATTERHSPAEHADGFAYDDGDFHERAAAADRGDEVAIVAEASTENSSEQVLDAAMEQAGQAATTGDVVDEFDEANAEEEIDWSADDPLAAQREKKEHEGKLDALLAKLNPLGKGRFTDGQQPRDTDRDGVPDDVDTDDDNDGTPDHADTDDDGDTAPHADADGVPDQKQSDLARALADAPPSGRSRLDLGDEPEGPIVGRGPAMPPPQSDSYVARLKRTVKPEYQGAAPTMPRGGSPRRGGRGRRR